jgi:hypothetical protein
MREEKHKSFAYIPSQKIKEKEKKKRSFLFWSLSCGKVLRRVGVRKI